MLRRAATICLTLACAALSPAQTRLLLDTRTGHAETLQTWSLPKFAIGHNALKTYWRVSAFAGADTVKQPIYGAGLFYEAPLKAHFLSVTWDTHLTLVVGLAGQWQPKTKPATALYLGLNL